MSVPQRIGRRGFFATSFGLAAAALATRFDIKLPAVIGDRATDAERLVRALSSPESAAQLGRAYLATAPHERSEARLVDRITGGLPGGYAGLRTVDDKQLKSCLAQRLSADFATADTVTVDGWVISRTEARLYALAAILV